MRVLMVSDVYFPRVNGVSTSMETFRRCLCGVGVEVRVVAPRYGGEPEEEQIIRVPGRPVPGDREDRLAGWRKMHRITAQAAADCDLIHIQTPFVAHYAGLAAARRHGLPVIATYHTLFEEYLHHYAPYLPGRWLRKQARALSRRQCNQLDAVVVPSTAMRERLAGYGVARPMQVLPTGIPIAQFGQGDGASFRRLHGIPMNRPLALFVGRVAHEKNIGFLLEAVAHARWHHPELLLVIAGEGPAGADLRARVEALGLAEGVRFVGYMDRTRELPDCYAAADAFVFASRTETQGLVLLEAMAAGVPVVALSVMGTADILAAGRGSIAPPDHPAAFGAALAELLGRSPSAREQLSAEARTYALEWSDTAQASCLASLYRRLAAKGRTRGRGSGDLLHRQLRRLEPKFGS